jgi:hypothetical protein
MSKTRPTNSLRVKNLVRCSEASKWLIGGFFALLIFTFDKSGTEYFKPVSVAFAFFGIVCCTISFWGYKKNADKLLDRIENNPSFKSRSADPCTYSGVIKWCYNIGVLGLAAYSLFVFYFAVFNPPAKNVEPTIINNIYDSHKWILYQQRGD